MNPRRIIVLDDSEICLEVARVALEMRGHHVMTSSSGLGFTSLVEREKPDLVLVDVKMPVLDGAAVVSILRKYRGDACPVVFLSDRPASELAALVTSTGAAGFICKTDDLVALADEAESYLRD
jgi:DNA-binding response OmpR family regulator